MLRSTYPDNHDELQRAFSRDDRVALYMYSKRTPESAGNTGVDMVRIESRKVVERSEVMQPVPETPPHSGAA
jgi:predicted SnoaL-like aldol condensation-catalyzing enzyme